MEIWQQNGITPPRRVLQKKADDAVVYQVMVALALLCCALLGLRALRSYYATVGGFTTLYDYAAWIGWGGVVLAGAALAATVLWKNRVARAILPWFCALGAVIAATGFSMRLAWVDGFSFLYYLCVAMALQYIVFKLYRWEFFLLSLSTVLAGGLYFCLSNGAGWTPRAIFPFGSVGGERGGYHAAGAIGRTPGRYGASSWPEPSDLRQARHAGLHPGGQWPVGAVHRGCGDPGKPLRLLLHVRGHRRGVHRRSVLHLPAQLE